jgi:hypothetical protein
MWLIRQQQELASGIKRSVMKLGTNYGYVIGL